MDKICLKILSVSIVFSVCSLEASASLGEMPNIVRAIVISTENIESQSTCNAARLLYIFNSDEKMPADIETLLSNIANQISVINNNNTKHTKNCKSQRQLIGNLTNNNINSFVPNEITWEIEVPYCADFSFVSSLRQRAGPCC